MASSSSSSLLILLFNICILFSLMNVVLMKSDFNANKPVVQLSVHPNTGRSTDNIEVRCEIISPTAVTPLSMTKFENIYLSVKTDSVKPSGILLMFDDSSDGCQVNRGNVRVDVCNASLIVIHINHTVLNDTLQKIDYSCSKGSTYTFSSYRIIKDPSARYFDAIDNLSSSSSRFTYSYILFVLLFVIFIRQIQWS